MLSNTKTIAVHRDAKVPTRRRGVVTAASALFGIAISGFALLTVLTPNPLATLDGRSHVISACDFGGDQTNDALSFFVRHSREIVYVDAFMLNYYRYRPIIPEQRQAEVKCPTGNAVVSEYGDRIEYAISSGLGAGLSEALMDHGFDPNSVNRVIFSFDWQRGGAQDRYLNVWFGNARMVIRGAVLPVFRLREGELFVKVTGVDIVATEMIDSYECSAGLAATSDVKGYVQCVFP